MEYDKNMIDSLKELTMIAAPSGFEDPLIKFMCRKISDLGFAPKVDKLGNVIVDIGQKSKRPKVMIIAHMDEIGLIIRKISEDGFLFMEKIGGIPEKVLLGSHVKVIAEKDRLVDGVVGIKAHHLTLIEERSKVVGINDIYIDIGCSNRKEVLDMGIDIGSPIVYNRDFFNNGPIVFSPTLDNRGGCLVLLELLKRLAGVNLDCSVSLVATVLEEYNLKGVLPAAREIDPDFAIALDVALACDTPDLDKTDIKIGKGPVVNRYSFHGRGTLGGVIPNPKLVRFVEKAALKANIDIQKNVFFGGLTDASFLFLENKGIPSIEIGFPARYTHSTYEACSIQDIEALIRLLEELVLQTDATIDFSRG